VVAPAAPATPHRICEKGIAGRVKAVFGESDIRLPGISLG
jgi:hypothetical protein